MTAPLTGQTVKSTLAHCRHGIMQSAPKGARRHITCVMVEKEQANPAQCRIRVAERSHLHGGDRHLPADPRFGVPSRVQSIDGRNHSRFESQIASQFHFSGGPPRRAARRCRPAADPAGLTPAWVQVNRSHADWSEIPSAFPICAQLTSRDRTMSTTCWSWLLSRSGGCLGVISRRNLPSKDAPK